jgi:hypothetical protein
MTLRVNIPLDAAESSALLHMAREECRHPRDQLRYLLRAEAERRGLILSEQSKLVEGELHNAVE